MAHFWQGLRSGEWLTTARARAYALILLVICSLAIIGWLAVSRGLIDANGKPIGTDFSNVYAAGELTWQGKAADAYDPALQHAAEKAVERAGTNGGPESFEVLLRGALQQLTAPAQSSARAAR